MKFSYGIILLFFVIVSTKKVKRKEYHHHAPPPALPHHYETPPQAKGDSYASDAIEYHAFHGKVISKGGYSAGTGLRVIAQGSADQANTAVVNQAAAGKQAAYLAQNTLAQAAAAAATTALAALQGKEVLLQKLEQQSVEAHQSLEGEIQQLQQAKRSAKAAQHAAQQSLNHVAVLTAALNNAQASAEHAQKAAAEAAAELASQTSMVGQAKTKLEQVEQQLHNARLDYEATRDAAQKASNSAQEAQNNANEAALHASIGLHESVVTVNGHEADFPQNHHVGDVPNEHQYSFVGYANYYLIDPKENAFQINKPICVMDPLELNHNVAKGISDKFLLLMKHYWMGTYEELANPNRETAVKL